MPDAMYWKTLSDPQGRITGLFWESAEGPIYELLGVSPTKWIVYAWKGRTPQGGVRMGTGRFGGGTKVGDFKTRKAAVDAARKHYYATTPGWGHGAGQRAGFGGGEHISWEQQMYEKRMATPAKKYIYRFKPGRHPSIEHDIGKAVSYARSKGLVVEENVEESLRGGPWKKAGVFPVADFRTEGRSARGRRARWGKAPAYIEISPGRYPHLANVTLYVKSPESHLDPQKAFGREIGDDDPTLRRFGKDAPKKVAREWAKAFAGEMPAWEVPPIRDTRGKRTARGRRAPLLKRQIKELEKMLRHYREFSPSLDARVPRTWDDLAPQLRDRLRRIKDQEDLHTSVDRWLEDQNSPFYAGGGW